MSRTTCPIVFASPWSAWQPSTLWKHLSNVHLGTLSTTDFLFHVHSCHLIYTGTSKRCEITHPKMILLPLIYPLHWIPEEQFEEKVWRCQVIKPYCLLNCFSSLLQFANPVHKGGIKSNQSGFLKSTILIIQIKLLEEQMRSDSNKCKGKRNKMYPDNVQKMRMSVFLKANKRVMSAVREVGHWPYKCLPCPTPRLSDGLSCLESWEVTHVMQVKFLCASALCTKPIWSNLIHAINSNSPRNLGFIVL